MKFAPDEIVVSVLMFVYNQEQYVRKAIESVIRQETDFAYEIIIHDDASTDGSPEIIREYARRYPDRIIPILQTENQMQQGISFVDTYMMPLVRGKYLAFLEGDDYWTKKDKLKTQAAFLEHHKEYAAVCHNCGVVDADGRRQRPVRKFYPYKRPYIYTLKDLILEDRMPGQTATVMYRYCIWKDMSPSQRTAYEQLRYCVGDRRRTLLILLHGPVYCMARTMSAYRYVTVGKSSWNARTHGKNLSGRYYVQERDFRKFAWQQYGVRLRNDYVLLGTALMAMLRYIKKADKDNKEQWDLVLGEHKSIFHFAGFLASVLPGAVYTLLIRTIRKARGI